MKRYWESLKPLERRWAVGIGGVVFLMLNYFFVWPHFHDWGRDQIRIQNAEVKIATYNKEVAKKSVYETKLRMLQSGGDQVLPEDQAIDFVRFYSSRMLSNHVLLLNGGNITTHTDLFFMNQQLGISVQADETNLVSFLYSLGAGSSMVRVRAMNLHPSQDRHELSAGVTMIASYQKKAPPRGAASGVTPAKNTVKPAAASTPAPAQGPVPGPGAKPPGQTNKVISAISRPSGTNKPGAPNIQRP
jgi:hypothetical protein